MVEWYLPDLDAISFDDAVQRLQEVASASHARLLVALTAPSDETIFGVLAADSADVVVQVCQQAGWHTDRVTSVLPAHIDA